MWLNGTLESNKNNNNGNEGNPMDIRLLLENRKNTYDGTYCHDKYTV